MSRQRSVVLIGSSNLKMSAVHGFTGPTCAANKKKLHRLSPRVNYTDRATATCRRSECQLLRIEGATWSA
jgi:hypothetical protein